MSYPSYVVRRQHVDVRCLRVQGEEFVSTCTATQIG